MKPTSFPISAEIEVADKEGYIFRVIGSQGDIYYVGYDYTDGWFCPCPDYQFRKHECKHITACRHLLEESHVPVTDNLFCEVEV